MTSLLSKLTLDFHGKPLTTLVLDGTPAWPAHELGQALGYAGNGRRLVSIILHEWSDEFVEGRDYVVLEGAQLAQVKAAVGSEVPSLSPFTARVVLLFESGFDLVALKTHKPLGADLRRFLADEILPRLRRGQAIPGRQDATIPEASRDEQTAKEALRCPILDLAQLREVRLWRQADLADRRFRSNALASIARWLHAQGRIDAEALVRFEVSAAQIALSSAPAGAIPRCRLQVNLDTVLSALDRAAA